MTKLPFKEKQKTADESAVSASSSKVPATITRDNPLIYVGDTGILAPTDSPAQELKNRGIGTMQVGRDFVVFATAEATS